MAIKARVLVLRLNLHRARVTARLPLLPKMRQPMRPHRLPPPLQPHLLPRQRLLQLLRLRLLALADHTYPRLLHGAFS